MQIEWMIVSGRLVLTIVLGLALAALLADAASAEGVITRVSSDWNNIQGDNGSHDTALSHDGRFVAFTSSATNLIANDTNSATDVFVRDMLTGEVTRVSTDSSGNESDGFHSWHPSLSADGRFVAFSSNATTLVPGDTNSASDIFVKDRQTGTTTRVSTDSDGNQANDYCYYTSISDDGRYVAFRSFANNLVAGDTNGTWDIFVKDIQTGVTVRASTDSSWGQGDDLSSYYPSLTGDGTMVAFSSSASNLVPQDDNGVEDIFLKDIQTGYITRVSIDVGGNEGDGGSYYPSISADGRYVAFYSAASNLVPGDNNLTDDIFVKDMQTGVMTRVSTGSAGQESNGYSDFPTISADGRYVTYYSAASNLVPGDNNGSEDIFFKDIYTGATTRLSTDLAGTEGNDYSYWPKVSGDGRFVSFYGAATNLVAGDTNNVVDAFIAATPVCSCDAPALTISAGPAFWASLSDYRARELSTSFQVSRSPEIGSLVISDILNSSGVTTVNATPLAATHVSPGYWSFTVKYAVPMGVLNYHTSLFTATPDACGNTIAFP